MGDAVNPFGGADASEWSDIGVRFKNVRFGVNQNYRDNDGGLPIVLIADWENESGNTREDQVLSIGGGYKAVEGGAAVEHPRARIEKSAGFVQGSKAQTLLDSLAAVGLDDLIAQADKTGGPKVAAFWEGITFHLVEDQVEFGKPDEQGKRRSYRQPRATTLYGWDVDFPAEDDEDGDSPTTGSPRAPKAVKTAADFGLAEDTFEKLVGIAKDAGSYEDFVTAVYTENDDLLDVPGVTAAVDDDVNGIYGNV